MLNAEQIKSIVDLGEGYQAEFKRSVPSRVREIAEEVCAFANSAGGDISRQMGMFTINWKNSLRTIGERKVD